MDVAYRRKSIVLTLLVHAGLLLILFFTILRIPIPPFGGGGGSSALGLVEISFGEEQPQSENQVAEVTPVNSTDVSTEENYSTQNNEEAPAVAVQKDKKKKKEKKLPNEIKSAESEIKEIEPPVRIADPFALYKGKKNNGSQGTSVIGSGDQGTRGGDPNSKTIGQGGSGEGTGSGNGTGDGTGDGSGPGTGNNKGFKFSLANRKCIARPKVIDRSQETGTVVVEITVNKSGSVVKANPGSRGTTTSSAHLWNLARQSAFSAKFNASPEAAEEQKGTITFVFSLE